MYQDYLKKYAEVIVKIGLNLQKDQELFIRSSSEASDLLEQIIEVAAVDCQCGPIHITLSDDKITRKLYEVSSVKNLKHVPNYVIETSKETVEVEGARLFIDCPNPTLLKGISAEKISESQKARSIALKPYSNESERKRLAWNIAVYVTDTWAKIVFPDLDVEAAKNKLWEQVLKSCRITEADPVASWKQHIESMSKYAKFLNESNIKTIKYKSDLTDFSVDLPENYIFESAGDTNNYNLPYVPNIPTEEIFSAPHMNSANGRLHSTMPLNLRGTLIENFWFDFKDGVVVDFGAENGYDSLKLLLETDEGAKRLGEIALVPVDSAISSLGTLFYNTLFDENASCHFALGSAYKSCVKGGLEMSEEDQIKAGLNNSVTHVDFMVGSDKMTITAITTSNKEITLFENGKWAFKL